MQIKTFTEVVREMTRQVELYGVQHLPHGTGHDIDHILLERAREDFERAKRANLLTWVDVIEEEYREVRAETDPTKIREELIQVIAVAMSWIRDIDNETL